MDIKKIKPGTKCWYMSVPNDNDWSGTHCLDGKFDNENYNECIVVNDEHKDELVKIINIIKELFNNHSFDIATEMDYTHYRVIVTYASNIKSVHVKSFSSKKDLLCQKRYYPRNLFKKRDDAIKMADEIARICGFIRTYRDD